MTNEHDSERSSSPTIEVRRPRTSVAQVVLGGDHDLASADRLNTVLTQTLDDCCHLIIDLDSTTFIDSSTIRLLVATKDRADEGDRRFNLVLGTASVIERALEITDVLTVLNRVHTLEDALATHAGNRN